jgi:hypothetical protein
MPGASGFDVLCESLRHRQRWQLQHPAVLMVQNRGQMALQYQAFGHVCLRRMRRLSALKRGRREFFRRIVCRFNDNLFTVLA